jgi:hypothetical protein
VEAVLHLLSAARAQLPADDEDEMLFEQQEEAAEAAGVALHALLVLVSGGAGRESCMEAVEIGFLRN